MRETRVQRVAKIDCEPLPAIELRKSGRRQILRWTWLLLWFMRVVSIVWIMHSVLNWGEIIGAMARDEQVPGYSADQIFATTVFFAVANPIAAVGLWLATPWGGVAWLVAVVAQLFTAILIPGFFINDFMLIVTDLSLVVCYFVVTWAASREPED